MIHNAGIYLASRRIVTEDGLAHVFQINTLAPYLLTALIDRPQRLIYTTSGLHRSGDASLEDLQWERRTWSAMQAYSDSKLHDALLAAAVARLWAGVTANSVDPGWVPTKMGGPSASDDLDAGYETQVRPGRGRGARRPERGRAVPPRTGGPAPGRGRSRHAGPAARRLRRADRRDALMPELADNAALIVVDLQRAFDDLDAWSPNGRRDNPAGRGERQAARRRVAAYAATARARPPRLDRDRLALAPGVPGNAFKPELDGVEPDLLVTKDVNAAFFGDPDLAAWLRERGIAQIVLCGVQTNHCVETTARVGGNLGFDVLFAADACFTFDRCSPDGELVTAAELTRATVTSLHQEFATVVSTGELVETADAG